MNDNYIRVVINTNKYFFSPCPSCLIFLHEYIFITCHIAIICVWKPENNYLHFNHLIFNKKLIKANNLNKNILLKNWIKLQIVTKYDQDRFSSFGARTHNVTRDLYIYIYIYIYIYTR